VSRTHSVHADAVSTSAPAQTTVALPEPPVVPGVLPKETAAALPEPPEVPAAPVDELLDAPPEVPGVLPKETAVALSEPPEAEVPAAPVDKLLDAPPPKKTAVGLPGPPEVPGVLPKETAVALPEPPKVLPGVRTVTLPVPREVRPQLLVTGVQELDSMSSKPPLHRLGRRSARSQAHSALTVASAWSLRHDSFIGLPRASHATLDQL
jgi:hypothetical protein